jgi:hypothetical protein
MNLRLQLYLYQLRLAIIIYALVLNIHLFMALRQPQIEKTLKIMGVPMPNMIGIIVLSGSFVLNDLVLYGMSMLLF